MKRLSLNFLTISTIVSVVNGLALPQFSGAPRLVTYVQTFADETTGAPLSILPILNQNTRVTHIILAALHLNDPAGNIHLNDNPPDSSYYDFLWPQVKALQQGGIKVMMMMGGAAQGSYQRLSGTDTEFDAYYQPLLAILKKYSIDGLDLDIEESVDVSVPLRLLQRLNADMGNNFILTMAPVASAMLPSPVEVGLSGFNYQQLDLEATSLTSSKAKLVDWFNCQFYNGWGDASNQIFYDAVTILGLWDPSRIVIGVLDNQDDGGSGFVDLSTLTGVLHQLRTNFPSFGGLVAWEYFNAGATDGLSKPYQWMQGAASALYDTYSPLAVNTVDFPLPNPAAPYPAAQATLVGEGAGWLQAVRALNITGGNLAEAQALLFPPS